MSKPPAPAAPAGQRIAKLLARAGIASRREVERMIDEGRVALNGEVLTTPATVLASLEGVTVDGRSVRAAEPARLFRFHKPAGLLTTERDPAGRRTIYDVLPPGLPRVMPVGRLDLATEGLLLLTTDGELKRHLELPATGVERVYRARTFGSVSQEQLEELIHGVTIEGVRYGSIDANLERRTGRNQWIEMRLREGKNREVRRVLEYLGLQVSRLIRTAYGPFEMSDLAPGGVLEVPAKQLDVFAKGLKLPKSSMPVGARAEPAEADRVERPTPAPTPKEPPARVRPARSEEAPKPRQTPARDTQPKKGELVDRPRKWPSAEARSQRGEGTAKPQRPSRPKPPSASPSPRTPGGRRPPTGRRPGRPG